MTYPPPPRKSHWLPTAFKLAFATVMIGSMVLLVVMLTRAANEGHEAIDAWAASVRAGAPVSESVAGPEAAELTAALRRSTSSTVSNFQGQSSTSCFWITLDDAQHTEVKVVLDDGSGKSFVVAASLRRSCDCPDDADVKCHLQ